MVQLRKVTQGILLFVFQETTAAGGGGVAKVGDTDSLFPPDQSEDYWLYCCRSQPLLGNAVLVYKSSLYMHLQQKIKGDGIVVTNCK